MVLKEINIKNKTDYFYDDVINLEKFNPSLLKLDKKSVMDINICYIGYVTNEPEYNINSVNPLYLSIKKLDGFMN